MSGDSYDYFYMKIDEYLNDLEYHTRQREGEDDPARELRLALIQHMIELKAVTKELEWYDSADSSELGKVREFVNKILNRSDCNR